MADFLCTSASTYMYFPSYFVFRMFLFDILPGLTHCIIALLHSVVYSFEIGIVLIVLELNW